MTPLRRKMTQDLKLAGLSERTQDSYLHCVAQLGRHYGKSPAEVTQEELAAYFVYLRDDKRFSRSSMKVALCAIKFLFERTLGRRWELFELVRPPAEKKLPVVLSPDEVWRALDAVRIDVYRVCLTTIYACGLRLMEGARLQVPDVDSARMQLFITGKGNRVRYVPLPEALLSLLREHWRSHRHPRWLFPARHSLTRSARGADSHVNRSALQSAFTRAVKRAGIHKRAHVHTLRHSYATHLLEAGVNLRLIQSYLDHGSPRTTAVYTHLTREACDAARDPVESLMRRR